MNYLELCQAVVDEVGLSGEITSVTNQRGDFARIVRFVSTACSQIEGKWINWRFLSGTYNFNTAADIAIYTAPQALRLRQWNPNRAFLEKLEIKTYYNDDGIHYVKDPISEDYSGRPINIIIENDNSLRFIGIPDAVYAVEIEYFKMATRLADNADVPAIPEQFHEIVVQDAIRRYANYDEAPELKQQAVEALYGVGGSWAKPEPGSWLHQLQSDQLPNSYLDGATEGGGFEVRVY